MSSESRPIDPLRFAEALSDLPLDALHAKAAELANSIAQLRSSNEQMVPFADAGDADCKEAMFENLGVITRMHERVQLIRAEVVEKRGLPWPEEGEHGRRDVRRLREFGLEGEAGEEIVVGRGEGAAVNGTGGGREPEAETGANGRVGPSGRLTDEELRRRVEAQMGVEDGEGGEEEGVHL